MTTAIKPPATAMETEKEYPDFSLPDEMTSVTLIVDGQKLHVHREILAGGALS